MSAIGDLIERRAQQIAATEHCAQETAVSRLLERDPDLYARYDREFKETLRNKPNVPHDEEQELQAEPLSEPEVAILQAVEELLKQEPGLTRVGALSRTIARAPGLYAYADAMHLGRLRALGLDETD